MNHCGRYLVGIALICACFCAQGTGQTLRVLSYNIHHGEGRDGRYDLARIAGIIKRAEPDVVALQELDHGNSRSGSKTFQISELARLTDLEGRFGKSMDYRGGGYGNGLLVGPKLEICSFKIHALPNPRQQEPRTVFEAQLRFRNAPQSCITLFATHMDVNHENAIAQAQVLKSLGANLTMPAVLLGDFNLRSTDPAIDRLAQYWTDAGDPDANRRPPIDFIMYSRGEHWTVRSAARFIDDDVTDVASDHYPLLAELELVEKTRGDSK